MLLTGSSIAPVDLRAILPRPLAPMALTMKSSNGANAAAYPGLHRVKAKGRYYYYAWRGGPRLPDPTDHIAFAAAWAEAHRKGPVTAVGPSFSELITAYMESPEWERLGKETRRVRFYRVRAIREQFGELSLAAIQAQEITTEFWEWRDEMRDRPKAADDHIETLSIILNWAKARGRISENRAAGISALYEANRSEVIFTPGELVAILAQCNADLARAVRFMALAGMRRGDVCDLRWRHIANSMIEKPTNKSRSRVRTQVPMIPEIRAILGETGEPDAPVFTLAGKPWKPRSLSNRFDHAAARAKVTGKHLHDLRGNAATFLFGKIDDDRVIEDWLGWAPGQAKEMRKRYASRRAIVEAIAAKLAA